MECSVLGDIPAPDAFDVVPGDVISFEWGYKSRAAGDGIAESSHKVLGFSQASACYVRSQSLFKKPRLPIPVCPAATASPMTDA